MTSHRNAPFGALLRHRLWLLAATSALALLTACAGTVKVDPHAQARASTLRVEGLSQLSVTMSPEASRQLADNPQFNRDELLNFLRRRLEGKGLLAASAAQRVEITLTDIRVRSTAAAVLLGFFAGDDHVTGRVRLLAAGGKTLHSFEVNASFALGGIGGGQDATRLNWLYDKFTELALAELEKVVVPMATGQPAGTVAIAVAPAAPASAAAATATDGGTSATAPTGAVALDDASAIPWVGANCRKQYTEQWLPRGHLPRAFVVSSSGRCFGTWGKAPDPAEPADPQERAMKRCVDAKLPDCTVYAVNSRVLWSPRPAASTAAP